MVQSTKTAASEARVAKAAIAKEVLRATAADAAAGVDPLPEVDGGQRFGAISMRLTLTEIHKLRAISKISKVSQHSFVLNLLQPAIDAEYARLV